MSSMQDLINSPDTNLIDVRTPGEVMEISVEGSVNIPLDTVPNNLERFREMEGPIVLFCRSGARSGNAVSWLAAQGIDNLYNAGGYGDVLQLKKS